MEGEWEVRETLEYVYTGRIPSGTPGLGMASWGIVGSGV